MLECLFYGNFRMKKRFSYIIFVIVSVLLTACSNTDNTSARKAPFGTAAKQGKTQYRGSLSDPIMAIASLSEHQQEWKGTRYRLGGTTKKGVDCSGFTQLTYRDLFGIQLPRMTVDQAKMGRKVSKRDLKTGDLVFFNTGRGPNGKHVGIFVKDDLFLHASTKGGVIYSSLNSPYWSKAFWQARRL